jgi:hypothetical protein
MSSRLRDANPAIARCHNRAAPRYLRRAVAPVLDIDTSINNHATCRSQSGRGIAELSVPRVFPSVSSCGTPVTRVAGKAVLVASGHYPAWHGNLGKRSVRSGVGHVGGEVRRLRWASRDASARPVMTSGSLVVYHAAMPAGTISFKVDTAGGRIELT